MDLSEMDGLEDADILVTLYALMQACRTQGAPRVATAVKAGIEEIMLLRGELDTLKDEYIEGVELTNQLVAALREHIANADDDPVVGASIKEWVKVVQAGG